MNHDIDYKDLIVNRPFVFLAKFGVWAGLIAAGFHPSRRDRLSTRVFRGKVFFGAVRTVTQFVHSSKKMKDRDPESFYSVVDHLLEVRAGL